ncbi:hypothetical protein TELCIR_02000 [Teladorsagia circumcincta]|uniref:Uncharacterized protein n=1 Tax=Teladorsagia circumcincta TaxID=45464 RepID=A0A2G9V0E4_TELCI|nr:hypothetical protein TELCIR_02000 [Teladorsagia circumcincta]
MSIMSELNAAKIQIEQYRVKLRKQSEEMEAISAERDGAKQLMLEFQKLDQASYMKFSSGNSPTVRLTECNITVQYGTNVPEVMNVCQDSVILPSARQNMPSYKFLASLGKP